VTFGTSSANPCATGTTVSTSITVLDNESAPPTPPADVVRQYIPTCVECNGFNLNDILTAIIKAVCDLQIQINDVVADVAAGATTLGDLVALRTSWRS
jgi:hypothetical protein